MLASEEETRIKKKTNSNQAEKASKKKKGEKYLSIYVSQTQMSTQSHASHKRKEKQVVKPTKEKSLP